jgi:ABC-2 type transport system ATP-binding protein
VIRGGKVLAVTSPSAARAAIAGRIWEGTVTAAELEELQRSRRVTQAVLVEGRNRVRVHEPDGSPPPGFEPVPPTLEDAYLVMVRAGNGGGGGAA